MHPKDAHDVVQGGVTASTAVYPYLLCRRFARALMQDDMKMFPVFETSADGEGQVLVGEEPGNPREDPVDGPEDPGEEPGQEPEDPGGNPVGEGDPAVLKEKLRVIHRNLGHHCKETLVRMLRDAGANQEVLQQAQEFECAECIQRGRRAPTRPGIPAHVHERWHTVSIDTFWWKYPKECLSPQEQNVHVLGLSIMDEATDFHTAVLVKLSRNGPLTNLSGEEFKRCFSEGWLQRFPAPTVLRYDEEGFMRGNDVKEWLELFAMKLEPIAGEAAWQMGKHSKHLQTMKEQMNLLSLELGTKYSPQEILALALGAKNSLHQIHGFSPYQWAFGKNHNRISSFLQQYDHLPLQSAREDPDFEDKMQAECAAQQTFLRLDARRRLARALRARCRPLKEFQTGQLVYYFRRGRKEGSRYGGRWHGPARVLCHESTSNSREHGGSVVWVSHGGVLIRCAPEQLRPVTRDLSQLDIELNGPRNFHQCLEQVSRQQRYLDLTDNTLEMREPNTVEDEEGPRYRLRSKRPAQELFDPRIEPLEFDTQPPLALENGSQGADGRQETDGRAPEVPDDPDRDGDYGAGRPGPDEDGGGGKDEGQDLPDRLPRPGVRGVGRGTVSRQREDQSGMRKFLAYIRRMMTVEVKTAQTGSDDHPLPPPNMKRNKDVTKTTGKIQVRDVDTVDEAAAHTYMGDEEDWDYVQKERVDQVETQVTQLHQRMGQMETTLQEILYYMRSQMTENQTKNVQGEGNQ